MLKRIYRTIGIHYGHNATVCLMEDGAITHAISEERFNRIKNSTGWPTKALEYIHKQASGPIDAYAFPQEKCYGYLWMKANGFESRQYSASYAENPPKTPLAYRISKDWFYKRLTTYITKTDKEISENVALKKEMANDFANRLNTTSDKIVFVDHHRSHALSVIPFLKNPTKPTLVFTLDGEGDNLCASVRIIKPDGTEELLQETPKIHSIGYLYREITALLGMKPDEHEFKVMGLAPYTKQEHVKKLLPIFEKLVWLDEHNNFKSDIPLPACIHYLKEKLAYHRFDNIAGAVQQFIEQITLQWIQGWIKKTNLHDLGLAGGVFMNVKMNQLVCELPEVSSLSITPSGGDESTVFGACIAATKDIKVSPLNNMYLGNAYTDAEIEKIIEAQKLGADYIVTKEDQINKVVGTLLAAGHVVARIDGRMEFGARALGNRSILANPSTFDTIRIINEMIKNRDFWMPFATSIIEEEKDTYLIDNNKTSSDFMIITHKTHPIAQTHLTAAIHPYDKTSRPQIVSKKINPGYHEIISEFKNLTGIGGVLNTSFNLHGEPLVESPQDGIRTLQNSGLTHLVIGSYLIKKIS